MNRVICAALAVSMLGSSAAEAQSVPPANFTATQNSSNPSNPSAPDSARRAQQRAQVAGTPQRKPQWLSDPKTGCAAFDIDAEPADGLVWSGACVDGRANGVGTATYLLQGKLLRSVTGVFDAGALRDGHVAVKWADGSTYDGDERAGRMDGSGVFISATGDRFQGSWINDHLNGHGLAAWANGDRYEGEWRDGKAEGQGVQIWADGRRYDGEWHNDQPNGHGVVIRKDGSRYEGEFADGQPKTVMQLAASQAIAGAAAATMPAADRAAPAAAPASHTNINQAPSDDTIPARVTSIDGFAGKTFVAVDGSTFALTTTDGGLSREIVAPNGAVQKSVFAFVNDTQGTVSDGEDRSRIAGMFRLTPNGIATDYSDGRSETVIANSQGGVSMTLNGPTGESFCKAWYPEGHLFSTDERKAALAEYASRLGLDDHKTPNAKTSCVSDADESAAARPGASPPPTPAAADPTPIAPTNARLARSAKHHKAGTMTAGLLAPPVKGPQRPIEVRDSTVHVIDAALPSPNDQAVGTMTLASNESGAGPIAASASSCLSVESDGRHWNFRNHCSYDVQFAYCLMNVGDPLASCSKGGVSGSVAPNGFSALIADTSLNDANADHDFRWVACGGGAGEVVVHLDRVDPPAGRCVRPGAS